MAMFLIFLDCLDFSLSIADAQHIKMLAYGRYDFNATANDELSFPKGASLKVSYCNSLFLFFKDR